MSHTCSRRSGVRRFFQSRLERFYQLVRQPAHQPYGIDEHNSSPVRQRQRTGSRIQGGKQLILRQNARIGECVEQGGFAYIGVTYNGYGNDPIFFCGVPAGYCAAVPDSAAVLPAIQSAAGYAAGRFPIYFRRVPGCRFLRLTGTKRFPVPSAGAAGIFAAPVLPAACLPGCGPAGQKYLKSGWCGPLRPGPPHPQYCAAGWQLVHDRRSGGWLPAPPPEF